MGMIPEARRDEEVVRERFAKDMENAVAQNAKRLKCRVESEREIKRLRSHHGSTGFVAACFMI
jgi:hypothetical protein